MTSPRILPPLEQGVSDLLSLMARLQSGPRIMDSLPSEPPVRPGYGLQGATVQPSDLLDKLRQPENWKFGSMPQGPKKPTLADGTDLSEYGLKPNPDGTVTLYHGTTDAGAAGIRKTGTLRSAGEPDVYLTTDPSGGGYGTTVVAVRVKPSMLHVDDQFPNGRFDFRIRGKNVKVLPEK